MRLSKGSAIIAAGFAISFISLITSTMRAATHGSAFDAAAFIVSVAVFVVFGLLGAAVLGN